MNSLIVYFSATGNTLHGCRLIREGITSAGGKCELASSREFGPGQLANCDLIGFACPVFAFNPAIPLLDLISRLPDGRGRPCFTFTTRGWQEINTALLMQRRLQERNYTVIARHSMVCEDSWTTIRFRDRLIGAGRPNREDRRAAIEFGRALPETWERFVNDGTNLRPPRFRFHPLHLVSYFYNPALLKRFFPVVVNLAQCDYCGLCVEQCPTGRMKFAGFPRPRGECAGCYGCVNVCPRNAVEGLLTRGRVRYRGIREGNGTEE